MTSLSWIRTANNIKDINGDEVIIKKRLFHFILEIKGNANTKWGSG